MSTNFDDIKWYSYTSTTETTRTWARRLESYEDIPPEFQSAFPKHKESFPYTLFIPEDRFALSNKRSRQIISVDEDHVVHLELARDGIRTFSSKFTDVFYLEQGEILLYSWLKIVTPSGALSIRFNTANDHLFRPIIEAIRQGASGSGHADNTVAGKDKQELDQFDHLTSVNFKYMNYGRKSVRSNDFVIGVVYQPERCIQEFKLFGRTFFRRQTTDHLSILTEEELILIKEDKRVRINKESLYGGVFTYIPRRQIRDISFTSEQENSHCVMEITLPENTHLASEFSFDNKELKLLQEYLG